MMVEYKTGDLFRSDAQVLVNPVNCIGVMGAGLALEFKKRYPEMYVQYKTACARGLVMPGAVHFWCNTQSKTPEWIANFPTKNHWKYPSKLAYVQEGLVDLSRFVYSYRIRSVAMPALGCGLGGLQFAVVKSEIEKVFAGRDMQVICYVPKEVSRGEESKRSEEAGDRPPV